MRNPTTCQYASCMETCENGVVITLRKKTDDFETKAEFCCAAHASFALTRLAMDRREDIGIRGGPLDTTTPRIWKVR